MHTKPMLFRGYLLLIHLFRMTKWHCTISIIFKTFLITKSAEDGCPELKYCSCSTLATFGIDLNCSSISVNRIKKIMSSIDQASIREFKIMNLDEAIKSIPNGIFNAGKPMESLVVAHSSIETVGNGAFSGLESFLERLQISHSKIKRLKNKSLHYLITLNVLNFTSNLIEHIETGALTGTPVNEIILDGNLLVKFNSQSFVGTLRTLKLLSLNENRIKTLDINEILSFQVLESLNIRSNLLEKVHFSLFGSSSLQSLDLSQNNLKSIDGNSFLPLVNLRSLNLSENQISYIYRESFRSLKSLNIVDLSFNRLQEVPSFETNTKLKGIYLKFNELQDMDVEAMNIGPSVERLDLAFNKLKFVTNTTFKEVLTSLSSLDLEGNNINFIDESSLVNLRQLEALNLAENALEGINGGLFLMKAEMKNIYNLNDQNFNLPSKIVSLKLRSNYLRNVGNSTFNFMTSLEKLDLSHNMIEEISKGAFSNCVLLKILDLQYNKLKYLGDIFFRYPSKLLELNLNNNQLQSIRYDDFRGLTQLMELRLRNNSINLIAFRALDDVMNLELLDFGQNNIRYIPGGAFRNFMVIKYLDISENDLTELTTIPMTGLATLEVLLLAGNEIMDIEPQAIQQLKSLSYLDLSSNDIFFVRKFMFEGPVPIKELRMANMDLQGMEIGAFQDLVRLDTLDLSNNDFEMFEMNAIALPNLKNISLSFNNLSSDITIDDDLKYVKSTVLEINLESCNLTEISRQMLEMAPNIRILNLKRNNLKMVNLRIFKNLQNLEVLLLDANLLTSLPVISKIALSSVTNLSISGNKISKFGQIASTTGNNLMKLNLSSNFIHRISSKSFNELHNLQVIDLSKNLLKHLDRTVFKHNRRLEEIFLDGNRLVSFKSVLEGFSHLSLKLVSFKNNPLNESKSGWIQYKKLAMIEKLYFNGSVDFMVSQKALDGIKGVSALHFTDMNLKNIGIYFHKLAQNLQHLDLCRNLLEELPKSVLEKFLKLRSLLLNENRFEVLPMFPKNLAVLEHLKLSKNFIKKVVKSSFTTLTSLKSLKLDSNKIVWIDADTFRNNKHLEELDLSFNELKTLDTAIFNDFYYLKHLHLEGNNLPCSCKYSEICRSVEMTKRIFLSKEQKMWRKCLESLIKKNCSKVLVSSLNVKKLKSRRYKVSWKNHVYPNKGIKLILFNDRVSKSISLDMNGSAYEVSYEVEDLPKLDANKICIEFSILVERKLKQVKVCRLLPFSRASIFMMDSTPLLVIVSSIVVVLLALVVVAVVVWLLVIRVRKR